MTLVDETLEKTAQELYLDLMKGCLTRTIFEEKYAPIARPESRVKQGLWSVARKALSSTPFELVRRVKVDPNRRKLGLDWPAEAETMIGLKRLNNLQDCIVDVLENGVAGDLVETGVWRGGATIFMRAVLSAYGVTDRVVWAADSFQGLPKPSADLYPADEGDILWMYPNLAVSLEQVQNNFRRYNLLDDQVKFLKGWFKDTIPTAPIEQVSVLRLDGDMYESTIDVLTHLYPKLSVGGYVIIDDFEPIGACKQAVMDYRAENQIDEEIKPIDGTGVYWQRLR